MTAALRSQARGLNGPRDRGSCDLAISSRERDRGAGVSERSNKETVLWFLNGRLCSKMQSLLLIDRSGFALWFLNGLLCRDAKPTID